MWSGTWGDGQCHGGLTSVRLCSRPQTSSWREKEKGGGIGLMMWFLFQTNENATKNVRSLRTFIHRKNPCCVFLTLVFAAKKEKTKRHKWTEKGNQLVYLWTLSTFLYVILLLGRIFLPFVFLYFPTSDLGSRDALKLFLVSIGVTRLAHIIQYKTPATNRKAREQQILLI